MSHVRKVRENLYDVSLSCRDDVFDFLDWLATGDAVFPIEVVIRCETNTTVKFATPHEAIAFLRGFEKGWELSHLNLAEDDSWLP